VAQEAEKQRFVEQYPGFFLVALGTLPAEEIRRRKRARARIPGLQPEETLALRYADALNPDGSRKDHPLRGQVFFLRGGPDASEEVLVGRGPTCEVNVADPSVSDIHCVIKVGSELRITDAQSTNGTLINLVRLPAQTETILNDGDIVSFGRCSFQIFCAGAFHDELSR